MLFIIYRYCSVSSLTFVFGGFHKATRIDYPLREFLKVQITKLQPVSDLQLMTPARDKNLLGTGRWIESITALITIAKFEKKSTA